MKQSLEGLVGLCVAFLTPSCYAFPVSVQHTPQQSAAMSLVKSAIAAEGGERVLFSVKSLALTGSAYTNHLQDSANTEGPWATDFEQFTIYEEFEHPASREVSIRAAASAQAGVTVTRDELISEGVDAVLTTKDGRATVNYTSTAHDDWYWLSPVRVMLTAKNARDLRVGKSVALRGASADDVIFTWEGQPVHVYIDRNTHLPIEVDYLQCYPDSVAKNAWGDMRIRVIYSNWELEPTGLHFPLQSDVYLNDRPLRVSAIRTITVNPDIPGTEFEITPAIREDYAQELHDVDATPLGQAGNGD